MQEAKAAVPSPPCVSAPRSRCWGGPRKEEAPLTVKSQAGERGDAFTRRWHVWKRRAGQEVGCREAAWACLPCPAPGPVEEASPASAPEASRQPSSAPAQFPPASPAPGPGRRSTVRAAKEGQTRGGPAPVARALSEQTSIPFPYTQVRPGLLAAQRRRSATPKANRGLPPLAPTLPSQRWGQLPRAVGTLARLDWRLNKSPSHSQGRSH